MNPRFPSLAFHSQSSRLDQRTVLTVLALFLALSYVVPASAEIELWGKYGELGDGSTGQFGQFFGYSVDYGDLQDGTGPVLVVGASRYGPLNGGGVFSLDLPSDGSAPGDPVAVSSVLDAGPHEAVWAGRDNNGRGVASGVYFARMEAGKVIVTQRLVLVQ